MFDVVTKDETWAFMAHPDIRRHFPYRDDLKYVQDIWMYAWLKAYRDVDILEAGGGQSRVLPLLDASNRLANADPLEGRGGGLTSVEADERVRLVDCYLGSFSPLLPDSAFDIVFSISVVEHIPTEAELAAFYRDCARVLRPGGVAAHLIDVYLFDFDAVSEAKAYTDERIRLYRGLPVQAGLEYVQPPREDLDATFRCRYATNPDRGMYLWNNHAPALTSMRRIAQSATLKTVLRKPR